MIINPHEHDRPVVPCGGRGPQAEEFIEKDHGDKPPPHADDRRAGESLDLRSAVRPQRYKLAHRRLRHGKPFIGTPHHQARNDGQCERHSHPHRRAQARAAGDVDGATDRLDIGFHDIHADPAARDARHLGGRREAGFEDELQDPLVGEQRGGVGIDQAAGDGLCADRLHRDAGPVVLYLDRHLTTLVEGPQEKPARPRLAPRLAIGGRLDAMVDGISHQMRERIADALDQAAVEFGVGTVDDQLHFPSTGDCQVSHCPWKPVEHMLDRLHAGLDGRLLKGIRDRVDPLDHAFEGRIGDLDAAEFVAGQDKFADEIENRGEKAHVDADGGFGRGQGRLRGL